MKENTIKQNQNNFDYKLFFSLILLSLVPAIYETLKVFFINNSFASLDVLSQIEWFDLIDEVLTCSLTVPLYYLLNRYIDNTDEFRKKVFHTGIITFGVYTLFSIIIYFAAKDLSIFMNANNIEELTTYLRIETIAFNIGIIYTFSSAVFVLIGKAKYIYTFLIVKTLSLIIGDFFLIPQFGSFGVGYANVLTNIILAVASILLLIKENCIEFSFNGLLDKLFLKDWLRVGLFEAGQIFLDNYIYAVMIIKMVNAVQEQGNYWIANNFIWTWLLIPSMALGSVIKKDCKNGYSNLNFKQYHKIILATIAIWIISIPLWNGIFSKLMAVENPSEIFKITAILVPFYITYLYSSYIDNIFYGLGKTNYTMFISFIVNILYYGFVYILFKKNIFTLNMSFIIIMFGMGMIVHLVLSIALKKIYLDKSLEKNLQIDEPN